MHTRTRVGLALLLAVAACSGGDPTAPPPVAPTGALAITISGLPLGLKPNVEVIGPNGYFVTIRDTGTTTLPPTDTSGQILPPGSYAITGYTVAVGSTTYGAVPRAQTVTLPTAIASHTAKIVYAAMTGQLAVTVNGPPGGLVSEVVVSGPLGYSDTIRVSGVTTLTGLPLGNYSIVASQERGGGTTYAALPAYPGLESDRLNDVATVTYVDVASVLSLTLNITGLPSGVDAAVVVRLPCPYTPVINCRGWHGLWTFTKSASLAFIAPGTYAITAPPVTVGTSSYTATPAVQSVVVTPASTGHLASVVYAP